MIPPENHNRIGSKRGTFVTRRFSIAAAIRICIIFSNVFQMRIKIILAKTWRQTPENSIYHGFPNGCESGNAKQKTRSGIVFLPIFFFRHVSHDFEHCPEQFQMLVVECILYFIQDGFSK